MTSAVLFVCCLYEDSSMHAGETKPLVRDVLVSYPSVLRLRLTVERSKRSRGLKLVLRGGLILTDRFRCAACASQLQRT